MAATPQHDDRPAITGSQLTSPPAKAVLPDGGPAVPQYHSFHDLPRLTHVCGAIIIVLGLANLALMLFEIEGNGLIWLFFYSIPANTAISVFPHEPAIIFCGQHFDAVVVAIVALGGTLLAGWVDYHFFTPLLQLQFAAAYKKTKSYDRAVRWFNIAPFWSVVIFALTPLPFYLVKFMVFSTGYSMPRFMAGIAVGRLPRFYLLALLGHFLKIPAWMIIVLFGGIFAVYLYWIVRAWFKARKTRPVSG
jgi:ribonucleoside-triphosphate reductase